jgi:hypothetical protein
MKTATTKTVTTLFCSLTLAALVATSAGAAGISTYLVAPGEPSGLPRFGFSGSNIGGYGERVVFVRYGGLASRLGLEPGDIILSLNGMPLTYRGSWTDALSHAVYHDGGFVRLRIRDVRTGHIVRRDLNVGGYGDGPVEHYNVGSPVAHYHNKKAPVTPHNNIDLTLKKIGKLVD